MTTLDTIVTVLTGSEDRNRFDEPQLAAAAFLSRYSGRGHLMLTVTICAPSSSGPLTWGSRAGRDPSAH